MDEVTLEDALVLFQLPRFLGETPEGEKIRANIGRFGPYLQYANKYYVSLKGDDDPYTITLERANELIVEKKAFEASRLIQEFPEAGIKVLKGRQVGWFPYVTDGDKNVTIRPDGKMPKDEKMAKALEMAANLSLEECQELIKKAPAKKGRKKATTRKKTTTKKKTTTRKKTTAKKKTTTRKKRTTKKT